jgi:hypothetical protein
MAGHVEGAAGIGASSVSGELHEGKARNPGVVSRLSASGPPQRADQDPRRQAAIRLATGTAKVR